MGLLVHGRGRHASLKGGLLRAHLVLHLRGMLKVNLLPARRVEGVLMEGLLMGGLVWGLLMWGWLRVQVAGGVVLYCPGGEFLLLTPLVILLGPTWGELEGCRGHVGVVKGDVGTRRA